MAFYECGDQGGFGDILYVSKRDRLYVTPMQVTNSLSPTDIHSMGTSGDRLCVVKRKEINGGGFMNAAIREVLATYCMYPKETDCM